MPIPDNIQVEYNDHVPLEPRPDQAGLAITAGTVASVPVSLPGEFGDIMSITVKGAFNVQFKLVSTLGGRADAASELVFAGTKELFLVPGRKVYISLISPDGNSAVIINCFRRGT